MQRQQAAISGLRPPVLDDLGLADRLAGLARSIGGVQVTVEADECALSGVEIALYRIAQEALQNVVERADAAAASVILRCDPGPRHHHRGPDPGRPARPASPAYLARPCPPRRTSRPTRGASPHA